MAFIDDFKARFPEFETALVDQYVPILEGVWPCYYGGSYEGCGVEIILNLVAHLLVGESTSGSSTIKSVASQSVGNVSESFVAGTESGGNGFDFWNTTKYGQRYWNLIRHNRGGLFV